MMKKLIMLCLIVVLVFAAFGCGNAEIASIGNAEISHGELRQKYPEYYNLGTFKGLEVYVWTTAENEYRCGVLPGTNRLKTTEELDALKANGATIEEMKAILSSYDMEKDSIVVLPLDMQMLSPEDHGNMDLQEIRSLFD